MNTEKNNIHTYSFRKRLYTMFYVVFSMTLLSLILYSVYFGISIKQRTYKDAQQLLALYNEQTSNNLKSVDYYLMEISNYSPEISSLAIQYDISDYYRELSKISQMFEFNLRSFTSIKGMYAFFNRSNTFIGYSGVSDVNNTFQHYLKQELLNTENEENIKHPNDIKWVLHYYNDRTYLVKAFVYSSSTVGAWTDFTTLASALRSLNDMESLILFSDEAGNIISIEGSSAEAKTLLPQIREKQDSIVVPIEKTLNSSSVITVDGVKYMLTTASLDYCDYYITAMIPEPVILKDVRAFWKYAILFLLAIVMINVIFIIFFSRILRETSSMIGNMTDAIIAGNLDHRIDFQNERCEEVRSIATAYNSMVDSIQQLKLDVYEERIQKKNFQLFFLRSQVAPHFLINCLNMISYLADGTKENTEILRKMIHSLSKHLRYTLNTEDHVPLSREKEYLDNYVELTKLRFPECITYESDFSEDSLDASVFPLVLIMFMENAFKFNLVMGEKLTVIARAYVYETNNEKRLHLTHIDSGEGYDDEFLKAFTQNDTIVINENNGAKVGITNIVKRLRLYYDESATMKLSNEPGMGARIDIDIPYITYVASSPKTDNDVNVRIFS